MKNIFTGLIFFSLSINWEKRGAYCYRCTIGNIGWMIGGYFQLKTFQSTSAKRFSGNKTNPSTIYRVKIIRIKFYFE